MTDLRLSDSDPEHDVPAPGNGLLSDSEDNKYPADPPKLTNNEEAVQLCHCH